LEGNDVERTILDFLGDITSGLLDTHIPEMGKKEEWNLEALNTALSQQFGIRLDFGSVAANSEAITDTVSKAVKEVYERQKASMGPFFPQVQKMILLQSIDNHWKEHLQVIDKLKEGINLRGYASKDPLIEYKKEAFDAFENLNNIIKGDVIEKLMKVQLVAQEPGAEEVLEGMRPESSDLSDLDYSSPSDSDIGAMAPAAAEPSAPERQKMSFNRAPVDDSKMNRADRRKMKKK
jgi:preprotein translocase subunit SecA